MGKLIIYAANQKTDSLIVPVEIEITPEEIEDMVNNLDKQNVITFDIEIAFPEDMEVKKVQMYKITKKTDPKVKSKKKGK